MTNDFRNEISKMTHTIYCERSVAMSDFDTLKQKYKDGYRCIYTEKDKDNGMTMHLKNFREEKIDTMQVKSDMEIGQIEDFLGELEKVKRKTGHDCHDL